MKWLNFDDVLRILIAHLLSRCVASRNNLLQFQKYFTKIESRLKGRHKHYNKHTMPVNRQCPQCRGTSVIRVVHGRWTIHNTTRPDKHCCVFLAPCKKWLDQFKILMYARTLDKSLFTRYQKHTAKCNWSPCPRTYRYCCIERMLFIFNIGSGLLRELLKLFPKKQHLVKWTWQAKTRNSRIRHFLCCRHATKKKSVIRKLNQFHFTVYSQLLHNLLFFFAKIEDFKLTGKCPNFEQDVRT